MTQPRYLKILSALGLNKARAVLFLGHPYTPKRILPIKMWSTPYKFSISHMLYQCGIYLGCYIHPPFRTQRPRSGLPHHRSRWCVKPLWYHMLWPNPDLARYYLFWASTSSSRFYLWGRPYTPKRVLPIKVWITPYKPNISPMLYRCKIRVGCYT